MVNANLDVYVGSLVNIFDDSMSLYGMLRKREQGKYRVDILRDNGYYCFEIEDVLYIRTENSIQIALK